MGMHTETLKAFRAPEPAPRARVLVVDDEPGILDLFRAVLSRYGFAVDVARHGRDALTRMAASRFDVVVSDVNMPSCDGLSFLRLVHERDLDVPVILMTGKPTTEAAATAVKHCAFRYLVKPLMPATIIDAIERAVRLHDVAQLQRSR